MAYRMGVTQVREREINAKKGVNFRSRIGERRTGLLSEPPGKNVKIVGGLTVGQHPLNPVGVSWHT